MAVKYVIDDETMTQIADPLRSLAGRTDELTPAEMAAAGNAASAEVDEQTELIAQIAAALEGKAAGGSGGSGKPEQEKSVSITENGEHTVAPDDGYTMSKVAVNVNVPDVPAVVEELHITENGTYEPNSGVDGYSKVVVDVPTSGGGEPGLPAGYARVDYIQFVGEQTVDTLIICNRDTKIKVVFTREKSGAHYMFGVASSSNTASVTAYMDGNWRFGNKAASKAPLVNADLIYSAILSSSEISITDAKTEISGVNEFETVGTLLLGACRSASGGVAASQFEGKILAWLMWSGDALVQKLVPVVSADGVYRFFDTVSQAFFDSITDTPLGGGNL